MTIIGEPQREYLHKRHKKAYNIKYSIYDAISHGVKKDSRILEMFGGIGINTYFLMKNASPSLLKIYEIDSICADFLKETYKDNNRVEVIEGDSINEIEDFDYIYIDGSNFSASNLSQYVEVFEALKHKHAEVFITDSGYFKFKFIKQAERPKLIKEYYQHYDRIFQVYNMFLDTVNIGNEFAVLWLSRSKPKEILMNYWTDETTEWKKVVTKYDSYIWKYKERMNGEVLVPPSINTTV